jgi:hypothetical protein
LDFAASEKPIAFVLDGTTWVRRTQTVSDFGSKPGLDNVSFVAEHGDAFYMVGRLYDSPTLLRSTDGLAWKTLSRPPIVIRNDINKRLVFTVIGTTPTFLVGSTTDQPSSWGHDKRWPDSPNSWRSPACRSDPPASRRSKW